MRRRSAHQARRRTNRDTTGRRGGSARWLEAPSPTRPAGIDLDLVHGLGGDMPMLRRIGASSRWLGWRSRPRVCAASLAKCARSRPDRGRPLSAEVVGFREGGSCLMALGDAEGISPGSEVTSSGRPFTVKVGSALLGRVIDGMGRPIDGKGPIATGRRYSITNEPPAPARSQTHRRSSRDRRARDRRAPDLRQGPAHRHLRRQRRRQEHAARDDRAQHAADVNVIALIGERGREVREFIERDLGAEGLARSVVVVATSDQPALVRIKGALVATAIAETSASRGRTCC